MYDTILRSLLPTVNKIVQKPLSGLTGAGCCQRQTGLTYTASLLNSNSEAPVRKLKLGNVHEAQVNCMQVN